MASLKKRPENTNKPWNVRWTEGGSSRRRSFRLKSEAQEWYREALQIEADEQFGRFRPSTSLLRRTLEHQWPHWQAARAHLSQTTLRKDMWVWRRWLSPYLGQRKLGSLTYRDLTDLLAKVSESGAGADTRIAVYTRLNMLMDDALGPGHHNCRQAVAGTSKRKRVINPLTDEELDRLLAAAPAQWRLFIDTVATLGLRPHEGCILRGRDILLGQDYSGRETGSTREAIDGTKIHVRTKKGNREGARTLPLPSRLVAPMVGRAEQVGRDEPLFLVPDYRNWRKRVWVPLVEAASMPTIVPYDLRHTAASRLISRGATVTDVAAWLGTSPEMVLSTYAHLFSGRLDEIAAILDR